MKKLSIRNLIIVILCITIIALSIGFAFLASKLESVKKQQATFRVVFSEIKVSTSVKGGKNSPISKNTISDDATNIKMSITLFNSMDELANEITVKNEGTIKAKIIDVAELKEFPDYNFLSSAQEPIKISHTDLAGKILDPGETTRLKVIAKNGKADFTNPQKVNYKISIVAISA